MPIRLLTSGGGTTTIQPTTSASSVTLTVPSVNANVVTTGDTASVTQAMLASNIATTGPAFSAYQSSGQTLSSSSMTKILFQTEEFDTNNCFANSTFTPNIAGYYQVQGHFQPATTYSAGAVGIYKNGASYKLGSWNANATGVAPPSTSCLVYCNGTTDYIELYGRLETGQLLVAGADWTWFQGYLVRAA